MRKRVETTYYLCKLCENILIVNYLSGKQKMHKNRTETLHELNKYIYPAISTFAVHIPHE